MPNPSSLATTLVKGLSSFWLRLFRDKASLDDMYRATEHQLGQAYFDVLEAVLARSLEQAPLFHREYWKLIELREDRLRTVVGGYEYVLDEDVAQVNFLFDQVLSPAVVLEHGRDYVVSRRTDETVLQFTLSPFELGFPCTTLSTTNGNVRQVAMWAPDALIDRRTLADNFGYLVGNEQPSTESYRQLLQGMYRFYVCGPTLANVESALNLAAGFPVVGSDTEIITALEDTLVVTDKSVYEIPSGSRKSTLELGQTLYAFDALTDAFRVVDETSDPLWWSGIVIPEEALPGESQARRTATPGLFPLIYDGSARYGDPGLYYGAHYTGVSSDDQMPLRQSYGFSVMDRLLKHNMVGVFVTSSAVPIDFTEDYIKALMEGGLPSHVFVYVVPASRVVVGNQGLVVTDSNGRVVVVGVSSDVTA